MKDNLTDAEVRAWARACYDQTKGRMAEYEAWERLAEGGREFQVAFKPSGKPDHGPGLMTPRQCFSNTARTVCGLTAMPMAGLRYAEGFSLTEYGFWSHHAWVVNEAGLVVDRTWKDNAERRYFGVTIKLEDLIQSKRPAGLCQLSDFPLGFAWGPAMAEAPEAYNRMFAAAKVRQPKESS